MKKQPKAFPIVIDRETQKANDTNFAIQEEGLTIRDYFAARAMTYTLTDYESYSIAVKEAYVIADAMMKARDA